MHAEKGEHEKAKVIEVRERRCLREKQTSEMMRQNKEGEYRCKTKNMTERGDRKMRQTATDRQQEREN